MTAEAAEPAPERQIATFGNTSFEFHLISELMDRVDTGLRLVLAV
jgi:hypothetical protein